MAAASNSALLPPGTLQKALDTDPRWSQLVVASKRLPSAPGLHLDATEKTLVAALVKIAKVLASGACRVRV